LKTEYAVGNIRIHFESRARRRWFVALLYALLAVCDVAGFTTNAKDTASAWIISAGLILVVGLVIMFTGVAGDMRSRGDEREMHRRDHAHYLAYRFITYCFIAALFASYFRGPNPITPLLPVVLREFLRQSPNIILAATAIVYITLPQAILLWTEPDMEEVRS